MPQIREAASTLPPENLALVFQEVLTAIVRLRANRHEVADAKAFREQLLHALKTADQNARSRGYPEEDVRLAIFAIVAFLDESILNLRLPVFEDWVRKPLQEELFGRHVAGEVFFENLQNILGRRDSPETADLLEVYSLCLLLGYLGRYSISSKSDLRALMGQTGDKIARIRNTGPEIAPQWAVPAEAAVPALSDRWMRPLLILAALCALLAVGLYPIYRVSLASGMDTLSQLPASQLSSGGPR
jgi:type VI secretion system protein ImpK